MTNSNDTNPILRKAPQQQVTNKIAEFIGAKSENIIVEELEKFADATNTVALYEWSPNTKAVTASDNIWNIFERDGAYIVAHEKAGKFSFNRFYQYLDAYNKWAYLTHEINPEIFGKKINDILKRPEAARWLLPLLSPLLGLWSEYTERSSYDKTIKDRAQGVLRQYLLRLEAARQYD